MLGDTGNDYGTLFIAIGIPSFTQPTGTGARRTPGYSDACVCGELRCFMHVTSSLCRQQPPGHFAERNPSHTLQLSRGTQDHGEQHIVRGSTPYCFYALHAEPLLMYMWDKRRG
jgi:hypothetical protein